MLAYTQAKLTGLSIDPLEERKVVSRQGLCLLKGGEFVDDNVDFCERALGDKQPHHDR
jgi:hypothetical protein